jgi:hypothetical protein
MSTIKMKREDFSMMNSIGYEETLYEPHSNEMDGFSSYVI